MKLENGGVTVEITSVSDAQRYLNAGYTHVIEQPAFQQAATELAESIEPESKKVEMPVEKVKVEKAKTGKKEKNARN